MNCFSRLIVNLSRIGIALLAALAVASTSRADFIVPDSATLPFQDWTRGTTNSVYAQWEVFTVAFGGAGNAPDVGSYPTSGSPLGSDARVYGNESSAFVTSGGNIYSFAASTDFTVTAPGYGNGAGWNTRFVAQLRTQGNPLDLSSLQLTYHDGTTNVTISPLYDLQLQGGSPADHLFVFDINGYNPASFTLDFNATASSMSLDRVAIDTFTTTSALTPVPEPGTALSIVLGIGGVGLWRLVRRVTVSSGKVCN